MQEAIYSTQLYLLEIFTKVGKKHEKDVFYALLYAYTQGSTVYGILKELL
jgi:hypothetical protein